MVLGVIIIVLSNDYLLDHANISDILVVMLIRIDIVSLDVHDELVDLESKSLCDLDSEMAKGLEEADLHLLLHQFWSKDYHWIQRLKVAEPRLFHLRFESLLPFVPIKEL